MPAMVPSKKRGRDDMPATDRYCAFATSPEDGQTLQCPEELPPEYGSRRGI